MKDEVGSVKWDEAPALGWLSGAFSLLPSSFSLLSIGLLPTLVKKLNCLHLHKKTLPVQSPTGRLFNLIYIGFTASITEE